MSNRIALLAVVLLASTTLSQADPNRVAAATTLPDGFQQTTVVGDLIEPTHMAFSGDGTRLIISELSGKLMVYDVVADTLGTFLTLPGSEPYGVVFDPVDDDLFYVFYNSPAAGNEFRVSRWTVSGDPNVADATSELVILEITGLGSPTHSGGDLQFGPDGMLYVTVGDGAGHDDFERTEPQSFASLMGKILRIDPSVCGVDSCGDIIPSDNPDFSGLPGYNAGTARGEIYARGFRNPYNSDFDPDTGAFYIIDVGTNASTVPLPADRFEEVNVGLAGANYAWNDCHGICNTPANNELGSINTSLPVDPIHVYDHTGTGKAIIGAAFYRGSLFPAGYVGDFFFADLIGGFISRLHPDLTVDPFATGVGMIVDLREAPDGSLYYLSHSVGGNPSADDGAVLRIGYEDPLAQVGVVSATVTLAVLSVTVNIQNVAYGTLELNTTGSLPTGQTADTNGSAAFEVVNNGTQTASWNIAGASSAGGDWAIGSAAGDAIYAHRYGTSATSGAPDTPTSLHTSSLLAAGVPPGNSVFVWLELDMPTDCDAGASTCDTQTLPVNITTFAP